MPDAGYYRAWRAAHPAYRARQTLNRAAHRRRTDRDRRAEYRDRASRALPPLPCTHTGHDIFTQARRIVGPRKTSLVTLYDPLYDDLLSVATLALIEGTDPAAAVKAYRTAELVYGRITKRMETER